MDETSTSVIAICCAKQDVQDLTAAIINIPPHTLGKGVEFIPYHLISVWKKAEYLDIYHQQNQYIHDTGAIAIQGIDTSVMEEEIHGLTFQQYLLSQEHILSIKKSDMPNTGKWWILVKKSNMESVTTFLNEDVDLYLTNSALKHNYTPPCDIPLRNTEQTDHTVQTNEYTSALLLRLKNRPKFTLIHTEPPPTGRVQKTYGRTYAQTVTQGPVQTYKHYGPQTTPHTGTPLEVHAPQYGHKLDALKKSIKHLRHTPPPPNDQLTNLQTAINEIRTASTLPNSTITNTEPDTGQLMRELTKRQEQQNEKAQKQQMEQQEKMMHTFQKMMKEMMTDMFKQMNLQMESLFRTIIPMLQQSAPPQTPPAYPSPGYTSALPQQMNHQTYPHHMYPGGPQSTATPVGS